MKEGQIILEAIWPVGDGGVETVVVDEEVVDDGVYLVHLKVHFHHGVPGRHGHDGVGEVG